MRTSNGGTWQKTALLTNWTDVSMLNAQVGWAVGNCDIYKTTTGGDTWTKQYSASSGFSAIDAVNAGIAWAVGDRGMIFKTCDGGQTWLPQTSGTTAWLMDIEAVDGNTAWAVGQGGIILHTIDGGEFKSAPYISSVAPSSGRPGSEITVFGTNFGYAKGSSYVSFGSPQAIEYTGWSDTRINFKVPAGATGQVQVFVVTSWGTSNSVTFTVSRPDHYEYYFAEGCTREGFSEWLCLQNPNAAAIEVKATYMLFSGAPMEKVYGIPPTARISICVNNEVGPGQDVSVKLTSTPEFYAERPMYFNYKQDQPGFGWTGGHCSTGVVSPGCDWYFAEGTTRAGFEEWICIQNPQSAEAHVLIDYISAGAYAQRKEYNIPAHARISAFVNGDVGPEQDVSVHVHCDQPIVAERPMYFNYAGSWNGGHVAVGTDSPKTQWYFAEGNTRTGFAEWLAVQNANASNAQITIRFFKGDGTQQSAAYVVGANSRWTLDVSTVIGTGVDCSAILESNIPVVAERPMYFCYRDGEPGYSWTGGHDVVGAIQPKTNWFFAEGCTRGDFEQYICVGNPGLEVAHITLTFMLEEGAPVISSLEVQPQARSTLRVIDAVGANHDVSTRLVSDKPVVAERPMYFLFGGAWSGGHDVIGF